ncbi:glycosyltransferase family 2 protein [Luteipulveratus flavus]|uniref:Glycosyltransferase family 2 protein n=1 Tax=Luteipulveratus flavus TaxID=3031728 RepID=A0ABT6C4T8_9MICO|nr:glycosyltransferase family 2 protein [Luteipulveratus sp. YIM 133296]MDF8263327.1 glycosyltransferase family 2 protein [Luteipulveratus sp. YIM 133296]
MTPHISVVVPMYNEQDVLPLFVQRLRPVLDGLGVAYEVVAVDDGSADQTPVLLQRFLREWPQLRVVRLRANSGHQAAISAGLSNARGDWIATIDADLQDPPEVLGEMLTVGEAQQADVVYGVRTDRSTDSAFKRSTARGFYTLMRAIGGSGLRMDAGDFRLMSRATVDAVNALPEHHRVLRLVIPTLGFPEAEVGYRRDHRAAGTSKYPLHKMLKLTLDSVTGFSLAPLRLATWFGMGGFVLAAALLAYAVISKIAGNPISGWTSTVVIVAGFAALQLLCLGILGEYVGRIYATQQARPTYYVAYDSLLAAPPERRPVADEPAAPARATADVPGPRG